MKSHQLKTHTIYCGDNLKMLPDIPDESVDLIYIDPPFNSNRNYEVFWGDTQERRAFNDRFGDVEAYIHYIRPRVLELYRVLKSTGSFYYHCDWHASHYVKVMLDEIFGFNNFINEIVWKRSYGHGDSRKSMGRSHDLIFLFAKTSEYKLNRFYHEHDESYIKNFFKHKDERGIYKLENLTSPNPRPNLMYEYKGYPSPEKGWRVSLKLMEQLDQENRLYYPKKKDGRIMRKVYLHELEGQPMTDIWTDIAPLSAHDRERLGYPTQKPIALLERIIRASSNYEDVILDAFCGCGTTLIAAQKLNRKWIGIDISPTACRVMADRLYDIAKLDEGKDFFIRDLRKTEDELLQWPPFEFQNWAVIALGGIPSRVKSGDFGIDGKLYPIELSKKKKAGDTIFGDQDIYYPIQVKQKEKVGRPDIDSFETAIRRDGRRKGYFVSFDYSSDAIKEIKRLDREGEIEIIPITVKELLKREV